ncbi:MAG: methylated-DNA--[protein]-cysteine S-methyltransferase [Defluviitaleaceae bacterium]|nr:methylated-DNA--[protein]-cysteine S-methyltransferase [Defluviitaleaceae bacterium]MCL2262236.1 methylated-DNA--[protein]-cysteine S-methyltransferase [Defluviitaleaceae bacterium]
MLEYNSPIGTLIIKADGGFITEIKYKNEEAPPLRPQETDASGVLALCAKELDEYFAGTLRKFTVSIRASGTPFRELCWSQLQKIPYGETISYKELAARIENPAAIRAVGGANHHNPINIIIPCHRVIGANGSLTGYGGGIARKEFLLKLEKYCKHTEAMTK